jgi:hypothetical protein
MEINLSRKPKGVRSMKHVCISLSVFVLLTGVLPTSMSAKELKLFIVVDSGAWADRESTVGWLSNDEIVFLGSENLNPKSGDGLVHPTISIWKIGKAVTIYKRHIKSLCFHHENIYYVTENENTQTLQRYYGPFGKEKLTDSRTTNPMTCESREEYKDQSRDIVPLLPEHGAIDKGPNLGPGALKNDPLVLLKKGSSEGITLPLLRREISGIYYYPFRTAYLVGSDYFNPQTHVNTTPWPAELLRPLWWLTPEGKVTKFTIPLPWNRSTRFFPTVAGIVVAGHDERRPPSRWPKDIGLFLIKPNGVVETLMEGDVRQVAVSPTGCGIAFVHTETPSKPGFPKLKSIKFCD